MDPLLAKHIKNSLLFAPHGVKIHHAAAVKELGIIFVRSAGNTGLFMIPGILRQQCACINIEVAYIIILFAVLPVLADDGEQLSVTHIRTAKAGISKSLRRD